MSLSPLGWSSQEWTSDQTAVLTNPRLPDAQRDMLLAAQAAMPSLPAHVWLTTSGSSGIKWVALSKAALLASAHAVNQHLGAGPADAWALALPTFHVGGLGILARAFVSGAAVHLYAGLHAEKQSEPRWDARSFHAFLGETRAALTSLVPTQLHDLVRAGCVSPPALRAVVVGGGALDPGLYQQARALGWPALPSYGLSECCSQVATAALSSLTGNSEKDTPPLVLLPHVAARTDRGGRIALQSPSLLSGYGLPPGLTPHPPEQARFVDPRQDGWFLTEDRGLVTGTVLAMQGRIGDFVKVGGESVDVARLQQLWAQTQADALPETVLTAAFDTRLGAAIHLFATGGPGTQGAVARAAQAFNAQVPPFERIRQVHAVDAIPRSPLGKLLRAQLLAQAGLRSA